MSPHGSTTRKSIVAGGFNGGGVLASADYDAAAGTWTTTVSMATRGHSRSAPCSTTGDFWWRAGQAQPGTLIATAEVYDPLAASASTPDGRWTAAGSMSTPRLGATLTLLPDGTALAAGGRSGNHGAASVLASTELYDPGTGTWSARAACARPDQPQCHAAERRHRVRHRGLRRRRRARLIRTL